MRWDFGEPQLAELNPIFEHIAYQGVDTPNPKEHPPQIYFSTARGKGNDNLSRRVVILMAMVGVVLLIACVNVAMLLITRNSVRDREFSLRRAFGASRTRLFGQLLTESLLIVAAGAALGWLFTLWSTGALAAWAGLDISVAP